MGRIALLITSLGRGGAEKQAAFVANHFSHEHDVLLLSYLEQPRREGNLREEVQQEHLGLRAGLKGPEFFKALIWTRRYLSAFRPDVLISFNDPELLLASLSGLRGLNCAHIASQRSSPPNAGIRALSKRVIYSRVSVATTNARATAAAMARQGYASASEIVVVPNATEVAPMVPARRDQGEFLWVCAASLSPPKDHQTLIRAAAILHRQGHRFKIRLVGDGPLRDSLSASIADAGLTEVISLPGPSRHMSEQYLAADATVLSSVREGLPNVILEAGSHGLVTVATDVGGVRETMPPANHRFLAPAGDHHALAEAMAEVMSMTSQERLSIGIAVREYVVSNYSTEVAAQSWDAALARALSAEF